MLRAKPIGQPVKWFGGHGKETLAIVITTGLILSLLFVPPAQAVSVSIVGLKASLTQPATDSFAVDIGIAADERIPVDSLTFKITGATSKTQTFNAVTGSLISGSGPITFTSIDISFPDPAGPGSLYGCGLDENGDPVCGSAVAGYGFPELQTQRYLFELDSDLLSIGGHSLQVSLTTGGGS